MMSRKSSIMTRIRNFIIYLGVMIVAFLIAGVLLHTLNLNSFMILPVIIIGCYLLILAMRKM